MKNHSYMLDTDTFSYLISNRYPAVRTHVANRQGSIVLSSITIAESLFGAKKNGSKKLLSLISLFRDIFPILPWDSTAAEAYSEIRTHMEKIGHPIGNMDMMIAAAAISANCRLVTNNERHFSHIPGLKIENWIR